MKKRNTQSLQEIALDFVHSRTESSFTKLYNRLRPGLQNMVLKYHTDEDTVSEILAITLTKAYTFVDLYDPKWNFSTWIYKICQVECLMELRRKNAMCGLENLVDINTKIGAVDKDDWIETPNYDLDEEDSIESYNVYEEIMKIIDELPEVYRNVLQDRELRKMKYEEIAFQRNLNINTVRSRIHVAKKLAKQKWIENKSLIYGKNIVIKNVGVVKLDRTLQTVH